jgi:hypothetical protein
MPIKYSEDNVIVLSSDDSPMEISETDTIQETSDRRIDAHQKSLDNDLPKEIEMLNINKTPHISGPIVPVSAEDEFLKICRKFIKILILGKNGSTASFNIIRQNLEDADANIKIKMFFEWGYLFCESSSINKIQIKVNSKI